MGGVDVIVHHHHVQVGGFSGPWVNELQVPLTHASAGNFSGGPGLVEGFFQIGAEQVVFLAGVFFQSHPNPPASGDWRGRYSRKRSTFTPLSSRRLWSRPSNPGPGGLSERDPRHVQAISASPVASMTRLAKMARRPDLLSVTNSLDSVSPSIMA